MPTLFKFHKAEMLKEIFFFSTKEILLGEGERKFTTLQIGFQSIPHTVT